jgi:hypothetical protein
MPGVSVNGYLKPSLFDIARAVEKIMLYIYLLTQIMNMEMQKTQEKNRYDNRAAIDIVI